jgi:Spy/CpxP family protein refolding chaperone
MEMTTKIYLSLFFMLSTMVSIAQTESQEEQFKKIKSYKVAYFTEELSLTADQASNFWPVYNQFEKAQIKMWQSMRKRAQESNMDPSNLSEAEAKKQLESYMEERTSEHERTMKLYKDLLEVLPANKVLLLPRAEDSFRRKLMRMHREKRSQGAQSNSKPKEIAFPLL